MNYIMKHNATGHKYYLCPEDIPYSDALYSKGALVVMMLVDQRVFVL